MDELKTIEYYEELMSEYQKQKQINSYKKISGMIILFIGFLLCVLGSKFNFDFITYVSLGFVFISIVSSISCEIKSFELKKIRKELENICCE